MKKRTPPLRRGPAGTVRKRITSLFYGAFRLSLFCLALSWAFSPGLSAESPDSGSGTNFAEERSRLIGISRRLGELNEKLRIELEDSKRTSAELYTTLGKSKAELDGLKRELELLRKNSGGLLNRAAISEEELEGLRRDLKKAESSLMNLELSFGEYRREAESRITRLERGRRFYRYGFFSFLLLALGGWTAFALAAR